MTSEYGVGQSKARAWRTCRQAYHYKYEEKIQRKRTKRPFMFGKMVHRMIEAKAQEDDPFEVLDQLEIDSLPIFTAEKEMYGEIVEDIRVIMENYFDFYDDGLTLVAVADESGEMRFAEHEFAVPMEDLVVGKAERKRVAGIVFKGQVDGLGRTPNKLRWLVEHKTHDKMPSDDDRWRNVQSIVYQRAVLALGWMKSVDGTCWNYVKSAAPTVPKLLKSGTRLSVQQICTLPSVVRATLKVHNLREEDHEELMLRAEQSRRDYFHRIYTPVNQSVSDMIFSGFVDTACEMRDNAGIKKDKNIGKHCSWCDYEPLCRAEFTGGDVDFVREGEFAPEDPEGYRRTKRRLPVINGRKA